MRAKEDTTGATHAAPLRARNSIRPGSRKTSGLAVPLAPCAQRALNQLATVAQGPSLRNLRGSQLLMERAWLAGADFVSGRSATDSCRFLTTLNGMIALSLARDSDWELIPAWLRSESAMQWSWTTLASAVRNQSSKPLVDQARQLGLAAANADEPLKVPSSFYRVLGPPVSSPSRRSSRSPRVIDLSALWAGPLCGHLLQRCGAQVIKVESKARPDGARSGNKSFHDLLNQGKRSVALDLDRLHGQRVLRQMILHADIVIESSRPRALRQMGICAEELLQLKPDLTWISITGYGRQLPEANWIAYGDDAGVQAGLSQLMKAANGRYEFAGDAIADPLTGIQAALVAWQSWLCGGSRLITLSLAQVAGRCLHDEIERIGQRKLEASFGDWWQLASTRNCANQFAYRPIRERVAGLGEDTDSVLRELSFKC